MIDEPGIGPSLGASEKKKHQGKNLPSVCLRVGAGQNYYFRVPRC